MIIDLSLRKLSDRGVVQVCVLNKRVLGDDFDGSWWWNDVARGGGALFKLSASKGHPSLT